MTFHVPYPAFQQVALVMLLVGSQTHGAVDYLRDVKPLLATECVKCHGASVQKGHLRLDTAAALMKGGEHGPAVVPGNTNSLLIAALKGTHDEIARMPYKRGAWDESRITLVNEWIAAGASHPVEEQPSDDRHWAFIPPERPRPPVMEQRLDQPIALSAGSNTINPIDAFVLNNLAQLGLAPSPEADRATLIRRLSLDLIGLPPTLAEVAEYISDMRPGAYERLVDRLLASPHFGERQGRIWLDLARYADSNGYSIDSPRTIWPYRDWVVAAINSDMPFDEFTVCQIAGDLLPSPSNEQLIATGFHRNTQVNHEGGIDPEQFRVESIVDRVNTTATVWLGVTLGCAQCHDHKFDPFTQREYYQMFAFFNSCENDGHGSAQLVAENTLDLAPAELLASRDAIRNEVKGGEKELKAWADKTLRPQQAAWEESLDSDARAKLTSLVRDLLLVPAARRNTDQSNLVWAAYRDGNAEYLHRKKELDALRRTEPSVVSTLVMKERHEPRPTAVLVKGDFTRPGEDVGPGTPAVLHSLAIGRAMTPSSHLTRLDLARWLVSPANPLTPRVVVNRLWQHYFGKGLVETENDFGSQGTPPSNQKLLDWMATELVAGDWQMKRMHRWIVTSATYRQSSHARPDLELRDPRNIACARQNRIRLDAEVIRDAVLAASGEWVTRVGGPPVYPPQPPGLGAFTQNAREWPTSVGEDRYRRALYTYLQRTTLYPALIVFDAPDAATACTRRIRSNTPLQSLTLLNDLGFYELAQALAKSATTEGPAGPHLDPLRMAYLFQRVLSRRPTTNELDRLGKLFDAERMAGRDEDAAWTSVARVLFNLDETVTRE